MGFKVRWSGCGSYTFKQSTMKIGLWRRVWQHLKNEPVLWANNSQHFYSSSWCSLRVFSLIEFYFLCFEKKMDKRANCELRVSRDA